MLGKIANLIKKVNQPDLASTTNSSPDFSDGNLPDFPAADDAKALYKYAYYWEFKAAQPDLERAAYYYHQAAQLGHADSMFRYAKYFENNARRLGTSPTQAEYWYQQAIKLGHKSAKYSYEVLKLKRRKGYRDL